MGWLVVPRQHSTRQDKTRPDNIRRGRDETIQEKDKTKAKEKARDGQERKRERGETEQETVKDKTRLD